MENIKNNFKWIIPRLNIEDFNILVSLIKTSALAKDKNFKKYNKTCVIFTCNKITQK